MQPLYLVLLIVVISTFQIGGAFFPIKANDDSKAGDNKFRYYECLKVCMDESKTKINDRLPCLQKCTKTVFEKLPKFKMFPNIANLFKPKNGTDPLRPQSGSDSANTVEKPPPKSDESTKKDEKGKDGDRLRKDIEEFFEKIKQYIKENFVNDTGPKSSKSSSG